MKRILTFECCRVFRSPWLYISLSVGLLISAFQVIQNYHDIYLSWYEYPRSLFNCWMGGEPATFSGRLLSIIYPILIVIPFSHSLLTDKKTHYQNNICIRVPKHQYIAGKSIVTFATGFAIGAIPYVFNLLISAMIYPALTPQSAPATFAVNSSSFLGGLFYKSPLLYIAIFLMFYSMFCGIIALLALALGSVLNNRFAVTVAPFLLYLILGSVAQSLRLTAFNPMTAFQFTQPAPASGFGLIMLCLVPLIFSLALLLREGKNDSI